MLVISNGILYNSFTNHRPLFTIFVFGEDFPSQLLDGLQSLHKETVEIIFDSKLSLSSFSLISNTQNEKLLLIY
jgi:hypothetical protein